MSVGVQQEIDGDLYHDVNTLLAYLRTFEVVELVDADFRHYGNKAPSELLRQQIDKVGRRIRALAGA